tara:strand:- start:57 stop:272 length:216 start_codon:yes stop_codon:yes gene_type:complete
MASRAPQSSFWTAFAFGLAGIPEKAMLGVARHGWVCHRGTVETTGDDGTKWASVQTEEGHKHKGLMRNYGA